MSAKRIALLLALVIGIAAMSGCEKAEYDWVVRVDGEDVPAGIYVMSEMLAYMNEQSDDTQSDDSESEDADEKIKQRAVENCAEYCFVSQEFEDRNLGITDEEEKEINADAENSWESVKDVYEENGLTYEYYRQYLTALYKEDMIFNDMYLNDEMLTRNADDITSYLRKNICRISMFCIPLENADGEKLSDEDTEAVRQIADDAKTAIEGGESVEDAACEYLRKADTEANLGMQTDNGEYVSTSYVNASYTGYGEEFRNFMFSMADGETGVYETDDCIYVVSKLGLSDADTDEEYQRLVRQAMYRLKEKEFDAYIKDGVSRYTIELNDQAITFYAPSKIEIKIK